jgi:hypothetical protein
VIIPENMDPIHSVILSDRRTSIKKITKTIVISHARVVYIIHGILDMRKLSAK